MGFLFSGVFWGIILILIGAAIIIRIVFNVNIPVLRIVFAVVLIYLGIRVLIGGPWTGSTKNSAVFQSSDMAITEDAREYNVIFGSSRIDATAKLTKENEKIEVNTIFGSSVLVISPDVPTIVKVGAAFSGVRMPDGNLVSFGDYTYKNKAFNKTAPYRVIKADVVFGSMTIMETAPREDSLESGPENKNSDTI
ncbi:MAG: hypothetical protein GX556_10000 [Fibrobacter sp.]|nr:hypothetical protein [Fibrobacter sp.]